MGVRSCYWSKCRQVSRFMYRHGYMEIWSCHTDLKLAADGWYCLANVLQMLFSVCACLCTAERFGKKLEELCSERGALKLGLPSRQPSVALFLERLRQVVHSALQRADCSQRRSVTWECNGFIFKCRLVGMKRKLTFHGVWIKNLIDSLDVYLSRS